VWSVAERRVTLEFGERTYSARTPHQPILGIDWDSGALAGLFDEIDPAVTPHHPLVVGGRSGRRSQGEKTGS
jgi:hypothetical protein